MIVQVLWAWRNDIRFSYLNEVNNHKKEKEKQKQKVAINNSLKYSVRPASPA